MITDRHAWRYSGETACQITAAVIGGASLAGAAISGSAAQSAAKTQAGAETNAANIMEQQYQQTRSDLLPYNTAGQGANAQITAMNPFNFAPTQAQLEATPGYQFNLSQGLKATQNSAASRGLGVSGAAEKGAASYASGLADTTYQNQFGNALNTYNTDLSKLQNQANLGENAAAQTGAFGTQTAANIGSTAVGAANASAAGTVGTANAITGGLNGISSALLFNNLNNAGSGLFGPGSTAASTGLTSGGQVAPFVYGGG